MKWVKRKEGNKERWRGVEVEEGNIKKWNKKKGILNFKLNKELVNNELHFILKDIDSEAHSKCIIFLNIC